MITFSKFENPGLFAAEVLTYLCSKNRHPSWASDISMDSWESYEDTDNSSGARWSDFRKLKIQKILPQRYWLACVQRICIPAGRLICLWTRESPTSLLVVAVSPFRHFSSHIRIRRPAGMLIAGARGKGSKSGNFHYGEKLLKLFFGRKVSEWANRYHQ